MENPKKKVLVLGRSGQVATSLQRLSKDFKFADWSWVFTGKEAGALATQRALVAHLREHRPQIIILAAAYTAVDKAEQERDLAEHLNHLVPSWVGSWAADHQASVIHFSSDYVYPGTGHEFWRESDHMAPVNWYGETKMRGDQALIGTHCHHLILRTSWVYSSVGNNFVKTMLKLATDRETLSVVSDQFGSPTSAADIAGVVLKMMSHPEFLKHRGVYNYTGFGVTTWCDFALEIFAQARKLGFQLKVGEVKPILTSQYPTPAKRPFNSRLNCGKIENTFGVRQRNWQESLTDVLKELGNLQ